MAPSPGGQPASFGLLAPLALAAALLLAACGGGGGGGSSFVIPRPDCGPGTTLDTATGLCRPPLQRQASCTSAQIAAGGQCVTLRKTLAEAADSLNYWESRNEFTNQPALKAVKAHYAFGNSGINNGYTGNGVTVAVIDDGIQHHEVFRDADGNAARLKRLTSLTFSNAIDILGVADTFPGSRTLTANAMPVTDYGEDCPFPTFPNRTYDKIYCNDHGTAVATPLAASNGLLGVAPKVEIIDVPIRSFSRDYCLRTGRTFEQCYDEPNPLLFGVMSVEDQYLARAAMMDSVFAAAVSNLPDGFEKPRYINVSLGYSMRIPDPILDPVNIAEMRDGYRRILEVLGGRTIWREAQNTETGAVFVVSAGNGYHEWGDYDSIERDESQPDGYRAYARQWKMWRCFTFDRHCPLAYDPSRNPAKDPGPLALLPLLLSATGLPAFGDIPEVPWGADLTPSFLAAVAVEVDEEGNPGPITFFSNRCGRAKDWCIAAPGGAEYVTPRGSKRAGTGITTAHGSDGELETTTQGTSFSSPIVVGALAVVDEAFRAADGTPQVSPHEVRRRILDTADRSGIYADRDIYGHGLLDVEAALSPQGMTSVPSPPRRQQAQGRCAGPGCPPQGWRWRFPKPPCRGWRAARSWCWTRTASPSIWTQGGSPTRLRHGPGLSPAALTAGQAGPSYIGDLGLSLGEVGQSWGGAMTPEYALDGASSRHSQLAAGAHLAVSPLVAASLDGGDTRHMAMRLRLGGSTLSAMACSQQPRQQVLSRTLTDTSSNCMALGWDYAAGQSFGLSLRAHQLNSGDGLYRYGLRCFGASCGMGGASATELGIGGFAKLAPGLRLGWNYWQGRAADSPGASGIIDYRNIGHRAGSIALQDAAGNWSLYLQQPLRATGSIALTLPEPPHPRPPNPLPHPQL